MRNRRSVSGDHDAYEYHSSQALSGGTSAADERVIHQGEPEATDGHIAGALSISRRTVIRIKQRFVQEKLEVAFPGSFPRERPERRCLDGKGEAQLINLACSNTPDGHQRWMLELLADQMVRLEYVEHISPETVRKTLKKTRLVPWLKKS